MLKTFVVNFEYNENEDDLCKTLGITDENWQNRIGKAVFDSDSKTATEDIVTMFESGKISGPEFIGLACGGLQVVLKGAAMATMRERIRTRIAEIDEEDKE